MKRTLLALLTSLILLTILPGSALSAPKTVDYSPVDVGPEIRGWEATADRIAPVDASELAAEAAVAEATVNASSTDCITDTKYFLIGNFYTGFYQLATFYLMGDGPLSQLWVQTNLAWPAGDPRPTPVITCEQVAYMISEFEANIYPSETAFFGMPDAHDGSTAVLPGLLGLPSDYYYDATGRQVILVSNIRDDNYYDPTYPIYVAGFYSPSFETYFDRNTMSIDAYDWLHRTGPNPPDDPPTYPARPYTYEGIFAHEYQHLLHDDYDPDEENFVNEGLSDLAMLIAGYPVTGSHLRDAAAYPENSLVVWGDQGDLEILSDYGQAFLFQYYLLEQFGTPYIQAEFRNPENGMTGVSSTLADFHIQKTFGDVFHDWSVALMIDAKTPGGGRYQFEGLDFSLNLGTPSSPNPEAFDTPGAPPWGTDYIWVNGNPKDLAKFTFNGIDYSTFPTAWTSDGDVLWSGTGDLLDNWAIFETTGGGTLSFDTLWDLEDYWDFGFVQVSTDGGHTWTSLEDGQGYATSDYDPNAHPKVVANLPGLTTYVTDWVTLTYDLSPYAGQEILIGLRLVTDWATHYGGWWVDNVYVDGTLISDGSDASVFKDITEILPTNNDFTVTFVGIKGKNNGTEYKVASVKLDGETEAGLFELNKVLNWADAAVMLVSFDAPEGFTGYAQYSYDFTFTNSGPKK